MSIDLDRSAEAVLGRSYHTDSAMLGASKINTYLRCPKSYEYQYVQKLPSQRSPAAAVGSTVHEIVRLAHLLRWTTDNQDEAADALTKLWERVREETTDPEDPQADQSITKAADEWLPWYLHWSNKHINIAVEEGWELEVPGTGIILRGTVDRIYRAAGEVVISDVKTGGRVPTEEDMATDLQLSLYAWACRQMGVHDDAVEIVAMRGKKSLRSRRTDAYLEHIVLPVHDGIQREYFPANPGTRYGCRFCSYEGICPIGRGGECDD